MQRIKLCETLPASRERVCLLQANKAKWQSCTGAFFVARGVNVPIGQRECRLRLKSSSAGGGGSTPGLRSLGGAGHGREPSRPILSVIYVAAGVLVLWLLDENENLPGQKADLLDTTAATVSVIIPAFNEEKGLPATLQLLQQLTPQPHEVIVVDGTSQDRTAQVAKAGKVKLVQSTRGRAVQMNAGAAAATGDILCFLHADSQPLPTLVAEIRRAMRPPRTVLGGFRTLICSADGRLLRFMTTHHLVKTHYLPAIVRPLAYLRGLRCLFGDQTMFCRAAEFKAVRGFDERLPIMEDADLCLRMHLAGPSGSIAPLKKRRRRGKVLQIGSPFATTSGRRLAAWGNIHATLVHFRIGLAWWFGASPERLFHLYHSSYTDDMR